MMETTTTTTTNPTTTQTHVWRFGYGSNLGLKTLQEKKSLNPIRYAVGTIEGWELYFMPGIPHVEPGWAAIRRPSSSNSSSTSESKVAILHGSAFCISQEEAIGLDRDESSYDILPVKFKSYDGEIVNNVGLYVPKKERSTSEEEGIPSLRYLRLLRNGAREGGLSKEWIDYLDSIQYYLTPSDIRSQTKQWIEEFQNDPTSKDVVWSMEKLAKYDGTDPSLPVHTSVMEYIVEVHPTNCWIFPSWKGHNVTRRNLLQYNGKALDANDIRYNESGFRPIPKISNCTEEEKEYLMQNLETLLHRGSKIVARLQPFLDDQK